MGHRGSAILRDRRIGWRFGRGINAKGHKGMAHPGDGSDLRERLAKAVKDCDTWRAAGLSEKYLEACSLKEALEAELMDARGQAGTPEALPGPVEPAASPPVMGTSADRAQLMADLSIAYDGLRYYYGSYRYDRLEDAVDYARLQLARSGGHARMRMARPAILQAPGDGEWRAMTSSGITYAGGVYRLGEYRYDRLADALAYARLQR